MIDVKDFHLKEYEHLRQEIMSLTQASADLERWCVVGSAAIIGFYLSEKFPRENIGLLQTVRFLPFALVGFAFLINIRRLLLMRMMADYIELEVEPMLALSGKGWKRSRLSPVKRVFQVILTIVTWVFLLCGTYWLMSYGPTYMGGSRP